MVPVVTGTGQDVSRSAAGRLAVECAVSPTGFGSAHWRATADPDVVRGRFASAHGPDDVDVRVDAAGHAVSASMLRWGTEVGPARLREFGADAAHHVSFAGISIPTKLRVGGDWGTDRWVTGEFFRARSPVRSCYDRPRRLECLSGSPPPGSPVSALAHGVVATRCCRVRSILRSMTKWTGSTSATSSRASTRGR